MIRLQQIEIQGFKDPKRLVKFEFAEKQPITVVYGDNGCGKTTFLRVLHALFTGNEGILRQEKVKHIKLDYLFKEEAQTLTLEQTEDAEGYIWSGEQPLQNETKTLYIGMFRGMFQGENLRNMLKIDTQGMEFSDVIKTLVGHFIKSGLAQQYPEIIDISKDVLKNNLQDTVLEIDNKNQRHGFLDGIGMSTIEKKLKATYHQYAHDFQDIIGEYLQEVMESLLSFQTLQRLEALSEVNIETLKKHRDTIIGELQEQGKVFAQIVSFLQEEKFQEPIVNSAIHNFYKKLADRLASEQINQSPVHRLQKVFNGFLGRGKSLFVDCHSTYIRLPDGEEHPLSELSSGERNLLSLLTLSMLNNGEDLDFLFIDEPENSLNIQWQRQFLPLLMELFPKAQIIVASHSPAIIGSKHQYLRELV